MRLDKDRLSVVLCGYHQVGCDVLEHLMQRPDISDLAVFTHEPGSNLPDLGELARRFGVWHSVESINEAAIPFKPDIIASVYYRNIISRPVIEQVRGRIFNVHPSLLPLHRGCSAVPWAIIEGDRITGVSFHYIEPGIDTGRILLQSAIQIAADETQATLYQRCMEQASRMWPAAFELVKSGFSGVEQEGESSYHRRGAPYGGQIDGEWPSEKIERFIRAMTFPPYPYAEYQGEAVKSWSDYDRLRSVHDDLKAAG